jgi:hypothetical protein
MLSLGRLLLSSNRCEKIGFEHSDGVTESKSTEGRFPNAITVPTHALCVKENTSNINAIHPPPYS